jgi:branched-chain amino acid transport system substrate-binding protein
MHARKVLIAGAVLAGLLPLAAARADDVVKIGNILALTGTGAAIGQHIQQAEKLYLKLHAQDLPKGVSIELITRDDSSKPDETRRLAQELIVHDHVQMLAGFCLSPQGFAVAPVITQAKVPAVLINATTGNLTRASPYFVRFSHSNWHMAHTVGQWAGKNGFKTAYSLVADYAAGLDMEAAFTRGFTDAGGKMLGSDHTPISTTDYLPYMDRVKAAKPNALFVFEIAGSSTVAMWKSYADAGLRAAGVTPVTTGDVVPETELSQTGAAALGMIGASIYSQELKTPENQEFVKAFRAEYGPDAEPDFESVAGWNAMEGIFAVVEKLGAKATGDAAMDVFKGLKLTGPNGPFEIDPKTRDIIENVYMIKVEKTPTGYGSVVFDTVPMVKDAWKELNPG